MFLTKTCKGGKKAEAQVDQDQRNFLRLRLFLLLNQANTLDCGFSSSLYTQEPGTQQSIGYNIPFPVPLSISILNVFR